MIINKKGLSDIIATVLIILLAIAAVAIVWSFISPTIRNTSGQIDLSQACFNTEVKPLNCGISANTANVQLTKGDPTKIKEILLVINQPDGRTTVGRNSGTFTLLGSITNSTFSPTISLPSGTVRPTLKATAVVMDPNDQTKIRQCDLSTESIVCQD